MKIFNKIENFKTKVNFVDDNNVVLGYDIEQQCCEKANWFISDTIDPKSGYQVVDLPNYNFDVRFIREDYRQRNSPKLEDTNTVIFRITNGVDEKFIFLCNTHNGYYRHGFDFDVGGVPMYVGEM